MFMSFSTASVLFSAILAVTTTQAPSVGIELNEVETIVLACVGSALGVVVLICIACYFTRQKNTNAHPQRQQPNCNIVTGNGSTQVAVNNSADIVDEIDAQQGRNFTLNLEENSFHPRRFIPSLHEETITPRDLQPTGRTLPSMFTDPPSESSEEYPENTYL